MPGEVEDWETEATTWYTTTWYTKRVDFGRSRTRVIRAEYTQPNGHSTVGTRWFPYSLQTGASWRGQIGDLRVTLTWGEPWDWKPRFLDRDGWAWRSSSDGRTLSFRAQGVEPEDGFSVEFFPGARLLGGGAALTWGDSIDLQATRLAELLNRAEKHWDVETGTVRFVMPNGGEVTVREGSRVAQIDLVGSEARAIQLPRPVTRRNVGAGWSREELWVPADQILEAVGFTVTIEEDFRKQIAVRVER